MALRLSKRQATCVSAVEVSAYGESMLAGCRNKQVQANLIAGYGIRRWRSVGGQMTGLFGCSVILASG